LLFGQPDLREVALFRDELARGKTVLYDGEVLVNTSREEKPFAAEIIRHGDEGTLRKSGTSFKLYLCA